MTFSDYQRVLGKRKNMCDLLGMKGAGEIQFEPAKVQGLIRPMGDSL
jgi:hypothetical protein